MSKYPYTLDGLHALARSEYRRLYWLIVVLVFIQTVINFTLIQAVFGVI